MTLLLMLAAMAAPIQTKTVRFRHMNYTVVVVNLKEAELHLVGQKKGDPHTFEALSSDVLFATNAGIFHTERRPVGLFVQQGHTYSVLQLGSGWGNFYLEPNGVFGVGEDGAFVVQSGVYDRKKGVHLATQSGPMLVTDHQIHSKFGPTSTNFRVRSGVGVVDEFTVVFALSEAPVRFYDFAALFESQLGCKDALFLDGTISGMTGAGVPPPPSQHRYSGFLVAKERRSGLGASKQTTPDLPFP